VKLENAFRNHFELKDLNFRNIKPSTVKEKLNTLKPILTFWDTPYTFKNKSSSINIKKGKERRIS